VSVHKTALVTGAARGIGRAIALALAEDGFDVALHYHHSRSDAAITAQLVEAQGKRAILLQGNLTNATEATQVVLDAAEQLGGLGVLVNNIGNYIKKPLLELEIAEWHEMLDSNLNASFYMMRSAIPLMRQAGGRIINLGFAGSNNLVARPGIVPYQIAKTGLTLLTKAIAKSEAPQISANIVAPGVIETSVSKPTDIPAGRYGQVEEIAAAVLYFIHNPYITGQTLEVAGGWNL
jgi:3-oxoacyl-[acyl-carrier protein] reductase